MIENVHSFIESIVQKNLENNIHFLFHYSKQFRFRACIL